MPKPNIVPQEPRVFTREEPCDKVHLYLCFFDHARRTPRRRAKVEARGEIGLNAIKYLKREGLAREYEEDDVDWWELTGKGVDWLVKGLARHLELHPEDASRMPGAKPSARARPRPVRR